MAALPYMQLYVAEYLADTMHLDALESGAYLHLLMNYWQTGKPLPCDDRKLARIAKCTDEQWLNICSVLFEFFENKNGFLIHKRVEKDLAAVRAKSSARAAAGRSSGLVRSAKSTTSNKCSTNDPTKSNYKEQDTDTDIDRDREEKDIGADAPNDVSRETPPSKPKRTPRDALCEILDAERAAAVLDHRRALRKPLTVRAAELLAGQFALARDGPNEAADRMIARGWQGYNPQWDEEHGKRNSNGEHRESREEGIERAIYAGYEASRQLVRTGSG